MSIEITPEVFTADYVGEPGQRTFYVQARDATRSLTYLVEKQQVALLAEKFRELLVMIDAEDTIKNTPATRDPALALEGPLEPEMRIGTIGLVYEEDEDRIIVVLQPVAELGEEEEVGDEEAEREGTVRLFLRRDQVRAFILHAIAATGEGRPICQLCGLPMDPAGHVCPASNGHRAHA
jgi:uncharacterized repeat protein (TIGR03847 family)